MCDSGKDVSSPPRNREVLGSIPTQAKPEIQPLMDSSFCLSGQNGHSHKDLCKSKHAQKKSEKNIITYFSVVTNFDSMLHMHRSGQLRTA